MKSRFLFAAAAAVALGMTSCSQDDVVEQSPMSKSQAIEFGTYLGNTPATRGTVVTTANLKEFAVTASSHGATAWANGSSQTWNFMYNQTVTLNGDDWVYNPVKYWPTETGAMVSFFAHSPIADKNVVLAPISGNGTPTITVTTPDDSKEMVDFVADAVIDAKKPNASSSNKVAFNLHHEMTRLAVSATLNKDLNADDKTTVVIKKITIGKALQRTGTYTFANANEDTNKKQTRGEWSFASSTTAETLNLEEYLDFNPYMTYNNKTYTEPTYGLRHNSATPGTAATKDLVDANQDPANPTQYLFFIPTKGTSGISNAEVEIEYDIVTADDNMATGYTCISNTKKASLTPGNTTVEGSGSAPEVAPGTNAAVGFLAQGVAYSLNITIGVDAVEMSAEVDPWFVSTVTGTF